MAKTYILEHDYFSASARLYKRGEKITLEDNHPAISLCKPAKSEPVKDETDKPEATTKKKKTSSKKIDQDIFG